MTEAAEHDAGQLNDVRVFAYSHVADTGAPPTSDEIAAHFQIGRDDARARLTQLGAGRQVVLNPKTGEIWMSGPFSAVPTRFRVHGGAVSWWANCAWDMLGIPASLGISARTETSCACCDASATIDIDAAVGPLNGEGIVHIFVPARRWYDDIGFT